MSERSLPLDALRGFAILLMVMSGRIPFGVLPDWMYHAQLPPPKHVFTPTLPGITWVDLVFPFFLFALGAAIPLALRPRLASGASWVAISGGIAKRGLLLVFFAVYVMHIRPTNMAASPGLAEWALSLAGFLLLFPMLATLPPAATAGEKRRAQLARMLGWLGGVLVLMAFTAKDGSGFSVKRSDIIILVLANVAVTGALIWWWTRDAPHWRLALLVFLLALRLTQSTPGLGQWLWNLSPWPWLAKVYFQQYLFIVLPATLVGDWLARWRGGERAGAPPQPPDRALRWVAGAGPLLIFITLIGLKGRWGVASTLVAAAVCVLAARALHTSRHAAAPQLATLFRWGVFWLMAGFAFEPFEGGIRKDSPTLSYYFVTTGLACFTLLSFMVWMDLARWRRGFSLAVAAGQNPLLVYAGIHSLLVPLLGFTGLKAVAGWLAPQPWLGVLRAWVETWALAWVAAWSVRRKLLLKT
ncbi:MAG: DUF5009 domain-containing protein [Betaproteobacteria bacterium]|nr:DUF5009 domain-containing protein [Betaproteobacteria bacterium]